MCHESEARDFYFTCVYINFYVYCLIKSVYAPENVWQLLISLSVWIIHPLAVFTL